MFVRLTTAVAALAVAVWLLYTGLGLLAFARNANAAYATDDLVETTGTVTRTGAVPLVPRDTVVTDHPPARVQVVPDPGEPVEVGQPRTVLVDRERTSVARYKHAELTRPGDRYYGAGGLLVLLAPVFAFVGFRVIWRVAAQRSPDVDAERVRFADHHRHGA